MNVSLGPVALLASERGETEPVRPLADLLKGALERGEPVRLVVADGRELDLPSALLTLLTDVLEALGRGQGVSVLAQPAELTTQQAADLLGVSRPHLVTLLERGEIPFHRVGSHRRITLEDLLSYRRSRTERRSHQLDELARLSQTLPGGYE